jgi:hypothetical protein
MVCSGAGSQAVAAAMASQHIFFARYLGGLLWGSTF